MIMIIIPIKLHNVHCTLYIVQCQYNLFNIYASWSMGCFINHTHSILYHSITYSNVYVVILINIHLLDYSLTTIEQTQNYVTKI